MHKQEQRVRIIDMPNDGGNVIPDPVVALAPRVETGAVQFGDDWTGLFIRGDDAFALMMAIDSLEHHFNRSGEDRLPIAARRLLGIRDVIRDDVMVGGGGEDGRG